MTIHAGPLSPWCAAIVKLFASGFGLGFLPLAPGTWGSLLGLPLAIALGPLPCWQSGLWLLLLTAFAVAVSSWAERAFDGHDASQVVIDEVVGMGWTFFGLSCGALGLALGFALFRWLDATKPGPIGWLDAHVPGGLGVVLDDVLAGVLACALLHGALWMWPTWLGA